MENSDRFEQLLKQRSFKELSEEDKNFALQFVNSEEEYESLRGVDIELKRFFERKGELVPHKSTLARIKASRAKEKPSPFWIQTSIPAYATALLILVVGAAAWWGGARFSSEKVIVERMIPKIDTVLIASKPDTVIRERIIYVPSNPVKLVSTESTKAEPSANKGVNMKEKEELEGLLVSGSY